MHIDVKIKDDLIFIKIKMSKNIVVYLSTFCLYCIGTSAPLDLKILIVFFSVEF